jgi:hypothetical protein
MADRVRDERGSALVTALLVSMLFLITGFAVLSTVDVQQNASRLQRTGESSFQLAEGALNQQIYRLSNRWPITARTANVCGGGYVEDVCPSTDVLKAAFTNKDYGSWSKVSWTTEIRDNQTGTLSRYYSDAAAASAAGYDANGDRFLWLRAQAVVRGRTRTLVALVKAEELASKFTPNKTLVAGWFKGSNNGNKTLIDNGLSGEVWVRCANGAGFNPPVSNCADYQADKSKGGQVQPERVYADPQYPSGMSVEALDQVRNQALSQGNYHQTCPPSLQGDKPGEVVFIESGDCHYNGNDDYNTPTQKGAVVMARGTMRINGNATFWGIIYHANVDGATGERIVLGGNVEVNGGIVVDGPGGVVAGSSKRNVIHDPNAGNALRTFGTVGIVQNSFREITAAR